MGRFRAAFCFFLSYQLKIKPLPIATLCQLKVGSADSVRLALAIRDLRSGAFAAATAKRFRPPAQGCGRGYPGIRNENDYPTARRLRHFFVESKKAQPRYGWAANPFPAQGAEAAPWAGGR